jgi:pimeloyl-ACP methyl ester carboxylesterase
MSSNLASITSRHANVTGVNLFYLEAGPKDAPTVVLLHGYPSSSRMYAPLIPLLADRYHLIAPDYPGFGQSEAPPPSRLSGLAGVAAPAHAPDLGHVGTL